LLAILILGAYYLSAPRMYPDQIPSGWMACNMKAIGYNDSEGAGAFKMAIRHVGGR